MLFNFNNKTVFITGGSRGIGKACALLFAQAGANVIFTYNTNKQQAEETLQQLQPGNHSMYQLNISHAKAIEQCFKDAVQKHQSIDIVINNAGVFIQHKIAEVTFDQWQQAWEETITTNLTGVSNLCYCAARHMIEQQKGTIINISSRGAFRGEPNHPAYGASKAGLNALSQSLAVALAPYNITVGVIAPGFVATDMANSYLQSNEGEHIKKQSPFNRVATPDEVARLAAVWASNGLQFMSGGIVDLNGASYLRS